MWIASKAEHGHLAMQRIIDFSSLFPPRCRYKQVRPPQEVARLEFNLEVVPIERVEDWIFECRAFEQTKRRPGKISQRHYPTEQDGQRSRRRNEPNPCVATSAFYRRSDLAPQEREQHQISRGRPMGVSARSGPGD